MSVSNVDHAALATSRLTSLWANKVKWRAFLEAVASAFDDVELVLQVIAQLDDVDAVNRGGAYVVSGVNLDVLGARIGQPRRITAAVPVFYFGWDEDDDALGWGEDDEELTGGSWLEAGQALASDAVLDDPTYRVAIRMRRVKNTARLPSFETFIASLLHVFPDAADLGTYALVLDEAAGTVIFGIGRKPTNLEVALLRYSGAFPKLAGISVSSYWWAYGDPVFAFDDDLDPSAAGWAEEGDPDAGGVFAEEF